MVLFPQTAIFILTILEQFCNFCSFSASLTVFFLIRVLRRFSLLGLFSSLHRSVLPSAKRSDLSEIKSSLIITSIVYRAGVIIAFLLLSVFTIIRPSYTKLKPPLQISLSITMSTFPSFIIVPGSKLASASYCMSVFIFSKSKTSL